MQLATGYKGLLRAALGSIKSFHHALIIAPSFVSENTQKHQLSAFQFKHKNNNALRALLSRKSLIENSWEDASSCKCFFYQLCFSCMIDWTCDCWQKQKIEHWYLCKYCKSWYWYAQAHLSRSLTIYIILPTILQCYIIWLFVYCSSLDCYYDVAVLFFLFVNNLLINDHITYCAPLWVFGMLNEMTLSLSAFANSFAPGRCRFEFSAFRAS